METLQTHEKKQETLVEGLISLIDGSLSEFNVGDIRKRLRVSDRTLSLAEELDYFSKDELKRLKDKYTLAFCKHIDNDGELVYN
jgi:hypothetical protein